MTLRIRLAMVCRATGTISRPATASGTMPR